MKLFFSILVCSYLSYMTYTSYMSYTFASFQKDSTETHFYKDGVQVSMQTLSTNILYKNNSYMGWFTSVGQDKLYIFSATSQDGFNWMVSPNETTINPDIHNQYICEKNVHNPSVLYDESAHLYRMYYTASCEPQNTGVARYWIKYASSIDGISWNVQEKPILSPTEQWESEGIAGSSVIIANGEYNMWYAARNSFGAWAIGEATSTDGENWTKNTQNPVIVPDTPNELTHIGTPNITYYQIQYYLAYYSAYTWPPQNIVFATSVNAQDWIKSTDNLLISITNEDALSSPSLVYTNTSKILFYTYLTNDGWKLGIASEEIPQPKTKYIIIPGLFGSWNNDAILHNKNVDDSKWKIPAFVTDYTGIIDTFDALGLKKNEDYYIYAYDWRRSLDKTSDQLNNFVDSLTKDGMTKVTIIGHSMGGVLGRIYAQKYGISKIKKLITVGSPHKGTAKVYAPLEAGEIERYNNIIWLAEKFILAANKNGNDTEKDTLKKFMPSLFDLLPTYNFLYKDNNAIDVNSMQIKNETLLKYNDSLSQIFPILETISGEVVNTTSGYDISQRDEHDINLDNYIDGKPIKERRTIGDYIVTGESSRLDDDSVAEKLDHGKLIYTKEGIETIIKKLDIPYDSESIHEGKETQVFPTLIFAIKSPATIEVEYNGKKYSEEDGIIYIPSAQYGEYTIKATGIEKGSYTIITGMIDDYSDSWNQIDGSIVTDPPSSQTDSYTIDFQKRLDITPTPSITVINNSISITPTLTLEPTLMPLQNVPGSTNTLLRTATKIDNGELMVYDSIPIKIIIPTPEVLGITTKNKPNKVSSSESLYEIYLKIVVSLTFAFGVVLFIRYKKS